MRPRVVLALAIAILASQGAVRAQRHAPSHPDLQGAWNGSTMTPLQRPAEMKDREFFTAGRSRRVCAHRSRSASAGGCRPTTIGCTQVDLDDSAVEREAMPFDRLRTSLIVEPPSGVLPPLIPAAQARVAAKPKRSFDDPEGFGLGERCLLGNFGLGGSSRRRRWCRARSFQPTSRSFRPTPPC